MKKIFEYTFLVCLLSSQVVKPITDNRAQELSAITGIGVGLIIGGAMQKYMVELDSRQQREARSDAWELSIKRIKELDGLNEKKNKWHHIIATPEYIKTFGESDFRGKAFWNLMQSTGVGVVSSSLTGLLFYKYVFSKFVDSDLSEDPVLDYLPEDLST